MAASTVAERYADTLLYNAPRLTAVARLTAAADGELEAEVLRQGEQDYSGGPDLRATRIGLTC